MIDWETRARQLHRELLEARAAIRLARNYMGPGGCALSRSSEWMELDAVKRALAEDQSLDLIAAGGCA